MSKVSLGDTRVGRIVAKHPSVARVFENFQIDYCCRGGTTLTEACELQKIEVDQVINAIEQIQNSGPSPDESNWNKTPLSELADHIVQTHHEFLQTELPRISGLVEKVFRAHGQKRPELEQVVETYNSMRAELELHMAKEENVLFPAIRAIDSQRCSQTFPFGSVANPIGMMEHEHDDAGNALRQLRELTNNFTPPEGACPTYRVMLQSLENLELDLHQHIHKENNILFPKAKELELELELAANSVS